MKIDYLAAGGQKWMLGTEGAAIFFCRRDLIERTRPLVIGAVNVKNYLAFSEYDYTLASTSRRFESGTYNLAGFRALRAAMELLLDVGSDAIAARIKHLTDRLIEGLKRKGYRIASPRDGEQWSGIVSFGSPVHDHDAVARQFRKEFKTEIVVRAGRLRASPHFYMTDQQMDRLIERLPAH
jgi:selenocysteine lyase/cysteine desulfurase